MTDVRVPAVPWRAGPRVMVVLSAAMGLLGLALMVLTFFSAAPLAGIVGAADTSTAVVINKTYTKVTPIGRGSKCNFYRFDVAWEDREGMFTICDNPDLALTRLAVGDEIVVTSVPWTSEVTPEGGENDRLWAVIGLVSGVWLVWLGLAWARRYHRLVRGVATGVSLSGRVDAGSANMWSVRLETPGLANGLMTMLPVVKMREVAEGEHVEVWSSRRSLLLRRPSGPWVVKARRSKIVFTHAWLVRAKSGEGRI